MIIDKKVKIMQEIQEYLKHQVGWSLVENELNNYKDNMTKLKFIHIDGYLTEMSLSHIKRNHKLSLVHNSRPELSTYNLNLYLKLNVSNVSIPSGEIYTGRKNKLKCICKIHGEFETTVNIIMRKEKYGRKYICKDCALENNRGEKHYNYNRNLSSEDREGRKYTTMYRNWIKQVYKRDDYQCQYCNKPIGRDGNAHHMNSWDWAVNERTDLNNGITLCKNCHNEFHAKYGYGNNTKEQTEYWLKYNHLEMQQEAMRDYECDVYD